MSEREIRIVKDAAALARAAAQEIADAAPPAIGARGRFTMTLSGGKTPRAVYELLATGGEPPFRERIDWERTLVFSGDERSVPPDHPDNNYRMAREALLARVPLPAANVVRFESEGGDPAEVTARFTSRVRVVLGLGELELPRFDLVLLGMGPDGHTASLFPGTSAVTVEGGIATFTRVEALATTRYTLTPATLNNARRVVFLVSGADKAERLREVLNGPFEPARLPAQVVRPRDGSVLWLVDQDAAARL